MRNWRKFYDGRPRLYADNFTTDAGTGGDTFGADDILGVKYPRSKLIIGADGTNDGDVSAANPLPVTGTIAAVTSITNAVTVNSHAVTNAGTFAVQVDGAALTAMQKSDDIVFVDDAAFTAATSSVAAVGGIVTADSVDSGDVGAFAMLANRQQKVTLYDSAGAELSVGGGTQYDEDTASASAQKLNMAGVTRADTAATQVDTDGDRTTLIVDSSGRLHVNVGNTVTVGSHAVTNAGTFAVQVDGNALTALQLIDDMVFTDDAAFTPATSKVAMVGAEFDDTAPDSVDEGDAGALRMSANRNLYVRIRDNAGNERGLNIDGNGALAATVTNATASNLKAEIVGTGTLAVQVDGSALTALQLIDDVVYAEDVAAQAADKGVAILAVRRDADTTLVGTDNDYANLQVDANGYLKVEIFDGGGSHTVDNAGTFAVQVDGNALTALQLIDDPVFADDAAFTIGTSKVMMAGGVVDDASTDSADEGDAAAVRLTATRQVVVNPQPHTTGGLTTARSLDLDETEEEIKATAGQVYAWNITNLATATRFVKFYNATAASVVVGTTTPLFTLAIPGNATDDTMLAQSMGGMGIEFDTAITWAATTGLADNDTGAPGVNEVAGTVWYK